MRRTVMLFCAVLLLAMSAGRGAAQTADTLKALLASACPLAGYLQPVHEHPGDADGRDRFVTLSVTARPQSFVQCVVAGGYLICEASPFLAGTHGTASPPLPLRPDAIASLERLGFDARTKDRNFTYRRAVRGKPDFDAIAVLMLTARHDAYGSRADTALDTYGPLKGNLVVACRL